MSPDCIFCQIVQHQSPASIVYEDDLTVAFMDMHQPTSHKVLVIPRAHIPMIYELEDVQAAGVMQTAVRVARAIRIVTDCDGLSMFQSNGKVAGQEVWHFHIHLLPKFVKGRTSPTLPSREALDRMAAELRDSLE